MKILVIILLIGALIFGMYVYMNAPGDERAAENVEEDVEEEVAIEDTDSDDVAQIDVSTVSQNLVGSWQSVDDESFVRVFNADGSTSDLYDGEAVSQGTYSLFSRENPLEVAFPLQSGVLYVQIEESVPTMEVFNFSLDVVSETQLEMTYMDRGGALRFVRLP